MPRVMRRTFWVVFLTGFMLVGAYQPVRYPDGAPPAHTGGFGEPSCQACHFGGALNEPGGSLTIEGMPEVYRAGQSYRLMVQLTKPAMARGGFQLAARFADGRQAGILEPVDDRVNVIQEDSSAVLYAQHTPKGTALTAPDTARWVFTWTPPQGDTISVLFHAAANAANDDASAFGDFIYTVEVQSRNSP